MIYGYCGVAEIHLWVYYISRFCREYNMQSFESQPEHQAHPLQDRKCNIKHRFWHTRTHTPRLVWEEKQSLLLCLSTHSGDLIGAQSSEMQHRCHTEPTSLSIQLCSYFSRRGHVGAGWRRASCLSFYRMSQMCWCWAQWAPGKCTPAVLWPCSAPVVFLISYSGSFLAH